MTLLHTQQLSLSRSTQLLVQQLDWQVARGERWCVIGRNGTGKTTLLQTLAGLLAPAAGTVVLEGQPLQQLDRVRLAQLRGMMQQHQHDAFAHSVFDAVAIGRVPYRIGQDWDTAEDVRIVQAALEQVGLAQRANEAVTRLSGGERQRVALAALLAQSPALMLLDEPFSHQDLGWQSRLAAMLRGVGQQQTIIFSSHDLNLALRCATHALVLAPDRHWMGEANAVLQPPVLEAAFECPFIWRGDWLGPA